MWWSLIFSVILSVIIFMYQLKCFIIDVNCDHLNLVFTNAAVCVVTLYFGSAIPNFYTDFLNGKSFVESYANTISPNNPKNYPLDEIVFWLFNTCFVLFFVSLIMFFSKKKSSENFKN